MSSNVAASKALRAKRLMGALFLGTFGTVWLMVWAYRRFPGHLVPVALIGIAGLGVLSWVYSQYQRHSQGTAQESETAEERRSSRLFHIVNVGQWVVILIVGNVLANIGLGAWVLPMAMAVIGAHFFPLARLFKTPSRIVTGAVLVAVAVVYPFVATRGPADPIGCLLAGVVLWASALWSVWHDG
jgi:hypothetical protein